MKNQDFVRQISSPCSYSFLFLLRSFHFLHVHFHFFHLLYHYPPCHCLCRPHFHFLFFIFFFFLLSRLFKVQWLKSQKCFLHRNALRKVWQYLQIDLNTKIPILTKYESQNFFESNCFYFIFLQFYLLFLVNNLVLQFLIGITIFQLNLMIIDFRGFTL